MAQTQRSLPSPPLPSGSGYQLSPGPNYGGGGLTDDADGRATISSRTTTSTGSSRKRFKSLKSLFGSSGRSSKKQDMAGVVIAVQTQRRDEEVTGPSGRPGPSSISIRPRPSLPSLAHADTPGRGDVNKVLPPTLVQNPSILTLSLNSPTEPRFPQSSFAPASPSSSVNGRAPKSPVSSQPPARHRQVPVPQQFLAAPPPSPGSPPASDGCYYELRNLALGTVPASSKKNSEMGAGDLARFLYRRSVGARFPSLPKGGPANAKSQGSSKDNAQSQPSTLSPASSRLGGPGIGSGGRLTGSPLAQPPRLLADDGYSSADSTPLTTPTTFSTTFSNTSTPSISGFSSSDPQMSEVNGQVQESVRVLVLDPPRHQSTAVSLHGQAGHMHAPLAIKGYSPSIIEVLPPSPTTAARPLSIYTPPNTPPPPEPVARSKPDPIRVSDAPSSNPLEKKPAPLRDTNARRSKTLATSYSQPSTPTHSIPFPSISGSPPPSPPSKNPRTRSRTLELSSPRDSRTQQQGRGPQPIGLGIFGSRMSGMSDASGLGYLRDSIMPGLPLRSPTLPNTSMAPSHLRLEDEAVQPLSELNLSSFTLAAASDDAEVSEDGDAAGGQQPPKSPIDALFHYCLKRSLSPHTRTSSDGSSCGDSQEHGATQRIADVQVLVKGEADISNSPADANALSRPSTALSSSREALSPSPSRPSVDDMLQPPAPIRTMSMASSGSVTSDMLDHLVGWSAGQAFDSLSPSGSGSVSDEFASSDLHGRISPTVILVDVDDRELSRDVSTIASFSLGRAKSASPLPTRNPNNHHRRSVSAPLAAQSSLLAVPLPTTRPLRIKRREGEEEDDRDYERMITVDEDDDVEDDWAVRLLEDYAEGDTELDLTISEDLQIVRRSDAMGRREGEGVEEEEEGMWDGASPMSPQTDASSSPPVTPTQATMPDALRWRYSKPISSSHAWQLTTTAAIDPKAPASPVKDRRRDSPPRSPVRDKHFDFALSSALTDQRRDSPPPSPARSKPSVDDLSSFRFPGKWREITPTSPVQDKRRNSPSPSPMTDTQVDVAQTLVTESESMSTLDTTSSGVGLSLLDSRDSTFSITQLLGALPTRDTLLSDGDGSLALDSDNYLTRERKSRVVDDVFTDTSDSMVIFSTPSFDQLESRSTPQHHRRSMSTLNGRASVVSTRLTELSFLERSGSIMSASSVEEFGNLQSSYARFSSQISFQAPIFAESDSSSSLAASSSKSSLPRRKRMPDWVMGKRASVVCESPEPAGDDEEYKGLGLGLDAKMMSLVSKSAKATTASPSRTAGPSTVLTPGPPLPPKSSKQPVQSSLSRMRRPSLVTTARAPALPPIPHSPPTSPITPNRAPPSAPPSTTHFGSISNRGSTPNSKLPLRRRTISLLDRNLPCLPGAEPSRVGSSSKAARRPSTAGASTNSSPSNVATSGGRSGIPVAQTKRSTTTTLVQVSEPGPLGTVFSRPIVFSYHERPMFSITSFDLTTLLWCCKQWPDVRFESAIPNGWVQVEVAEEPTWDGRAVRTIMTFTLSATSDTVNTPTHPRVKRRIIVPSFSVKLPTTLTPLMQRCERPAAE